MDKIKLLIVIELLIVLIITTIPFIANSKIFYIDPVNGSDFGDGSFESPFKTFQYVINNNLIESYEYVTPYDNNNPKLIRKNIDAPIKAGDTLILYSGLHGQINIVNYVNDKKITVMNAPGNIPILKSLHLRAGKNWVFDGLEISSEPYGEYLNQYLVHFETHGWLGPVSNIVIKNCNIYSSETAWTDSLSWITKASDGIYARGDSITVVNNTLTNVHFGIRMVGNFIQSISNKIINFSADGIRLIGSNNLVQKNLIANCYDVDDNHDDAIQSFTTGGHIINNNVVKQNIILNYTDPEQPLLGPLQGISCFDGPAENWIIENNLVVVNHWHGIALYGIRNSKIINNTVLDPTPDKTPGPSWIKIVDIPNYESLNCVVKNNIINTLSVTNKILVESNILLKNIDEYDQNFVDFRDYNFHLLPNSICIDAGSGEDAPSVDIEDNPRPSGNAVDIGAYEYQQINSVDNNSKQNEIIIYPNPVKFGEIIKISVPKIKTIYIYDIFGKLIYKSNHNYSIPTEKIGKGFYIVFIEGNINYVTKLIIN